MTTITVWARCTCEQRVYEVAWPAERPIPEFINMPCPYCGFPLMPCPEPREESDPGPPSEEAPTPVLPQTRRRTLKPDGER